MMPTEAAREPIRQAWRDIHEALYYAANATRCAQFTDFADLHARRSDIEGDLDALRCMQQGGRLTGDQVRRYERLHEGFTTLMRQEIGVLSADAVAGFVLAVQALEEQLWALVPTAHLPAGMFAPSHDAERGRLHLVRRDRRTGGFSH